MSFEILRSLTGERVVGFMRKDLPLFHEICRLERHEQIQDGTMQQRALAHFDSGCEICRNETTMHMGKSLANLVHTLGRLAEERGDQNVDVKKFVEMAYQLQQKRKIDGKMLDIECRPVAYEVIGTWVEPNRRRTTSDGEVTITLRRGLNHDGTSSVEQWAVERMGYVLNKQGEWEWEPQPSSRDRDYLDRTRFDNPEEALETYKRYRREQWPI